MPQGPCPARVSPDFPDAEFPDRFSEFEQVSSLRTLHAGDFSDFPSHCQAPVVARRRLAHADRSANRRDVPERRRAALPVGRSGGMTATYRRARE